MENEIYKGGLNKIAKELNIERKGEVHQAGSDSLVTNEVFFKLIENNTISKNDLNLGKNIMYGIGDGADDSETILYTKSTIPLLKPVKSVAIRAVFNDVAIAKIVLNFVPKFILLLLKYK